MTLEKIAHVWSLHSVLNLPTPFFSSELCHQNRWHLSEETHRQPQGLQRVCIYLQIPPPPSTVECNVQFFGTAALALVVGERIGSEMTNSETSFKNIYILIQDIDKCLSEMNVHLIMQLNHVRNEIFKFLKYCFQCWRNRIINMHTDLEKINQLGCACLC